MWNYLLLMTALVAIIQAIPVQQTNDDEPIESEIFNGHDADRDEWPWTVLLKMGQFGGDICSGTLMSKRWVLTVATCVFDTFEIIAVVGEYDRLETNSSKEEIAVDKKILHPGFNIATLENNVALLRLSRNVVFNRKNIGRIPALSNETIDDQVKKNRGFPCYVAGWGYYIDDSGIWTLPSILQELKVRIIRNKRCNELRAGALLNTVTDDMVCYMAQRASTCAGDTGDPLMCYVNDEWTLIGVHCFKYDAIDGCRGGAKVAFRISAYRDWITSYVVRFSD